MVIWSGTKATSVLYLFVCVGLYTVKRSQHKIVARSKRFEVRPVSRQCFYCLELTHKERQTFYETFI